MTMEARIYNVEKTFFTINSEVTQSCPTLWDPMDLHSPWNFSGQNTGVGSLSLLQGIFPTQGSNLGLLHCRHILYQLSHKGSRRILKWVAYPFFSESSWPRKWTRVSCIAGGFFTNWAIRGAHSMLNHCFLPPPIPIKSEFLGESEF